MNESKITGSGSSPGTKLPSPGKFLFPKPGPDSFRVIESSENMSKMTPLRIFIAFLLANILKNFEILLKFFLKERARQFL